MIVDDYDLTLAGVNGPLGLLADALGHAADIGLHVLLARRVAGSSRSSFEAFGQRLRELTPTSLVLDGDPSEGPLVGDRTAAHQPPGRGFLVRRQILPTLVQLAVADDADLARPRSERCGGDMAVKRRGFGSSRSSGRGGKQDVVAAGGCVARLPVCRFSLVWSVTLLSIRTARAGRSTIGKVGCSAG